jgi:hypothetical protein
MGQDGISGKFAMVLFKRKSTCIEKPHRPGETATDVQRRSELMLVSESFEPSFLDL